MELIQKTQDKATRSAIAADCTQLIDQQVSAKGGLSGMALKTAYKVVKGISADYIPGALTRLMPETFANLDPIWAEGKQAGDPVAYMSEHRDRTADAILAATDDRIARAGQGVISTTYNRLRKSVKSDVVAAVPGLAAILQKHVG
ncbi:hypothetical protein [cf. Phormidesmis sp. LEGE 11477]|uniref:DUF6918 family protein n=1 Tax=cf. Phormidesmis sp. LEGE 11477 TaxID=1828680 RepID=UPI001882E0CA|nr:hypothetical protein [cf. Phormidesmis sp. LEGE 11477]MBE9063736.1 hypothetical protein [cf. Phormidesmis sp. LEGE 11477]